MYVLGEDSHPKRIQMQRDNMYRAAAQACWDSVEKQWRGTNQIQATFCVPEAIFRQIFADFSAKNIHFTLKNDTPGHINGSKPYKNVKFDSVNGSKDLKCPKPLTMIALTFLKGVVPLTLIALMEAEVLTALTHLCLTLTF